jgi:hypothetical protein
MQKSPIATRRQNKVRVRWPTGFHSNKLRRVHGARTTKKFHLLKADLRVDKKQAVGVNLICPMVGGRASLQVHSRPDEAHQSSKVGSHDEFAALRTRANLDTAIGRIDFDGQIYGRIGVIVDTEGVISVSLLTL